MKLSVADLVNVARGAAFLGTGGGGDPYIGRMLATSAIQEFGMPQIIEPEELDDDATVYTIAMLGAPTGAGVANAIGASIAQVAGEIDILVGTLGKSLASMGAYVLSQSPLAVDTLVNQAGELIYSTYMAPARPWPPVR